MCSSMQRGRALLFKWGTLLPEVKFKKHCFILPQAFFWLSLKRVHTLLFASSGHQQVPLQVHKIYWEEILLRTWSLNHSKRIFGQISKYLTVKINYMSFSIKSAVLMHHTGCLLLPKQGVQPIHIKLMAWWKYDIFRIQMKIPGGDTDNWWPG